MTYLIQITFLCCLSVFEGVSQPIGSEKWKAKDISNLRKYFLKQLRDELYELPPTLYFQDYFRRKAELPPTLYFQDAEGRGLPPQLYFGGDEPGESRKLPPSMHSGWTGNDYTTHKEVKKDGLGPLPPILAGSKGKDSKPKAPPKVHSGWRAGDAALGGSSRVHSGSRAGDAILRGSPKHSGSRAGDAIIKESRRGSVRSKMYAGWRAGDTE